MVEQFKLPVGNIKMFLHKGGFWSYKNQMMSNANIIKKYEDHNLIVNGASILMAMRMAPGNSIGTVNNTDFVNTSLKYLAVGTGTGDGGTIQNPMPPAVSDTILGNEIFRQGFTSWGFLTYDSTANTYSESPTPTNILEITTVFDESQLVNATITEMGLFGGDTATDQKDTGYMFNAKRFPVWNKPANTELTIVWRITF